MDELTRFARRLVEQLAATAEGVNRPVPIGLIREKILPYRTHRRALQLDSVEDYETVLLRLVSGERGFVRAAPAEAGDRCREELAGANPDLGVLDEIADSTILVTSMAAAQIVADEPDMAPAAPPPARQEPAPRVVPPPAPVIPSTAKGTRPMTRPSSGAAPADRCTHAVPAGRKAVFCPWCGERLIPFTCARCQTELESEWRHCITCGAPVKDPHRYS